MRNKVILAGIPVTLALIAAGGWTLYRWLARQEESFKAADILYDLLSDKVGTISQVIVTGKVVTVEYVCSDIRHVFAQARWKQIAGLIQNAAVVDVNLVRLIIRGQQQVLLAQIDISPAGLLVLSINNQPPLVQE
jgi:hypothetical protein